MYNGNKPSIEWNSSLCNPFNMDAECDNITVPKTILVVPEKPHIINIKNANTIPFVDVERLRTPIDGFEFKVYEYDYTDLYNKYIPKTKEELDEEKLVGTYLTSKYQAYLPADTFKNDSWYAIICTAINNAGISPISNMYELDQFDKFNNLCFTTEVSHLDCNFGFCGSHIYVCE